MADDDVRAALQRHWAAPDANDLPNCVVSIMEFDGSEVVRETQYFSEPFTPGPSRAQWVEPIA